MNLPEIVSDEIIVELNSLIQMSNCWTIRAMYKLGFCLNVKQKKYDNMNCTWQTYLLDKYGLKKHDITRISQTYHLISQYPAIGYTCCPITFVYNPICKYIRANIAHNSDEYNHLVTKVNTIHDVSYLH